MRADDAPRAGWYPDPEFGVRLRWWNGVDWADRWRSRPATQSSMVAALPVLPTAVVSDAAEALGDFVASNPSAGTGYQPTNQPGGMPASPAGYPPGNIGVSSPWGSAGVNFNGPQPGLPTVPAAIQARQMYAQARQAGMQQAQLVTQQSIDQVKRAATSFQPLVDDYASTAGKLVRKIALVIAALIVFWFVMKLIATQAMWNWVSDRIDNLGTSSGSLIQLRRLIVPD